jgi:hypothetical protein
MHIAYIAQDIGKEDTVHSLGRVAWMCPDEEDSVFGGIGNGPEGVRLPRGDLVGWVGGHPNGIGKGVAVRGADTASKNLGGLGLCHMEVEGWTLERILSEAWVVEAAVESGVEWRKRRSGGTQTECHTWGWPLPLLDNGWSCLYVARIRTLRVVGQCSNCVSITKGKLGN